MRQAELEQAETESLTDTGDPISRQTRRGEDKQAPARRLAPDSIIDGKYRLLRPLGEGSFGAVYLVEHIFLGQRFSMKVLRESIASSMEWVARFREEARATSLIGHEGIVFVTDFGHARDVGYYFVMEYLDGVTLQRVLKQQRGEPLEVERVTRLALHLSSALAAVHDIGIIHCDLKPSNIMLTQRGDGSEAAKILDFGVSNRVTKVTETDNVFGTPPYMAPEQTLSMDVDGRADQFSLAVIVYQALTGRMPWVIEEWRDATPWRRERNPPEPPSTYMGDQGSEEIDRVLLRALEVEAVRRWPDIQSFAWGLAMATGVEWSALPDPWDRAKVSRVTHAPLAPRVEVSKSPKAHESLMVYVDSGSWFDFDDEGDSVETEQIWSGPILSVHFRTIERLRREWRRNLLAGALFAPTDHLLPLDEVVGVRLIYEPLDREITIIGKVKGFQVGPNAGLSIRFEEMASAEISEFIKSLRLGVAYRPEDLVVPLRDIRSDDDLDVGQAFLATRINRPMTFAQVRLLCTGLPIDIDVSLSRLVQNGYFMTRPQGVDVPDEASMPTPPPEWHRSARRTKKLKSLAARVDAELEESMAMVEYFVSSGNYMSAIGLLYKALEIFPHAAELHYRLGMLHAQFERDFERAQQLLETAVRLRSEERRYQMALEYLDTLRVSAKA